MMGYWNQGILNTDTHSSTQSPGQNHTTGSQQEALHQLNVLSRLLRTQPT